MRNRIESLIEEMLDGQILLNEALSEFEKIYIQKALRRCDEHLSNTANELGIHRNTLSKKIAAYQTETPTPETTSSETLALIFCLQHLDRIADFNFAARIFRN
jgi:DNA-binding NtrC family response regulator